MTRLTVKAAATATVVAGVLLAAAGPGLADGPNELTNGRLQPFATGAGLDIDGRAWLVRAANGSTYAFLAVGGLQPRTTYPSHVHAAACDVGDADGHYQFVPGGPAEPPNEIWLGPFTTNRDGYAVASTSVDAIAGAAAVSVVVHAPDGSKIACADLA